jgi:hypothetical protein
MKIFFCYDKNLFKFLHLKKKIPFITIAINPKSKRTFSEFVIDDELQRAINEFKFIQQLKSEAKKEGKLNV